jgi:hypothetical protein
MCKNKRRKKKSQLPSGAYKRFLKDVYQVLSLVNIEEDFLTMSIGYKRMMHNYSIRIRNPVAGNACITPKELKLIAEKTKKYYHECSFALDDISVSCYQLQLIYSYMAIQARNTEKRCGFKDHPDVIMAKDASYNMLDGFIKKFMTDYFRVITQLSYPDQKYYGVNIEMAPLIKENPRMELVAEIFGVPARKCMINLNGHKRPAYQLGKATAIEPVMWISLNVSLFGKLYKGKKQELDVFVQSHALRRLRERLDLLNQESINYVLWENTTNIEQFETYRGYLLLPFKVFDVKIGYLVANIIEDKLLFRTFLFITHQCTPEGDRLKELTGLDKQEMSYWRIDRLSTFVNLDEERYPELIQLFCEAGLGDLMKIKDNKFNIDVMQAANLNGLTEYVIRGQQENKAQAQEWNTILDGLEKEHETFLDYESKEKIISNQ